MLITAITLFALAAILGMLLISFVLKEKETPTAVVFTHGPLAVVALILLIVYAFREGPNPTESIILFAIAAAGGIVMVTRDITRKPIPKWLAVVHAIVAIAGFVMLLIFAFFKPN